jgi:hypothetical protein
MSLEKIRMAFPEAGTTGRIAFPGVFFRVAEPEDVQDTASAYGKKDRIRLLGCPAGCFP